MNELPELRALLNGVKAFHAWRSEEETKYEEPAQPSLGGTRLSGRDLQGANFRLADLNGADLSHTNLQGAQFDDANLSDASLFHADLRNARFVGTNLSRADLQWADMRGATFYHADLQYARLVDAQLDNASLEDCGVYGVAVWNLSLANAWQSALHITPWDEPMVNATDVTPVRVSFDHSDAWNSSLTVDDIEVAQFLYMLLKNEKLRQIIDTIATKLVLILGRFTRERKKVLDTLRDMLREHGYFSVVFDFDRPASRTVAETVSTIAHMARFVVADLTDARSIPQELQAIVPNLTSVPVQPIILSGQLPYATFEHLSRYPWVLPLVTYRDIPDAIAILQPKIIAPAEAKAKEIGVGALK